MAKESLSPERIKAGADFLAALRRLGLDPESLFWAYDENIGELAIVLITSFYDQVGPLEINKLLFRAYNLAVTPASISPFIVRLQSPKDDVSRLVGELVRELDGRIFRTRPNEQFANGTGWKFTKWPDLGELNDIVRYVRLLGMPLRVYPEGFYIWRPAVSAGQRAGQWQKIRYNLNALAA